MKTFARGLVFTFLALSGSAFAASDPNDPSAGIAYRLNVDVSLDGKRVASPRTMVVKEGQSALFTQMNGDLREFVEVVAEHTGMTTSPISMVFTVGTIGPNGERHVVARPRMVVYDGEPAKLTETGKDGHPSLSLSVIAHRTTI